MKPINVQEIRANMLELAEELILAGKQATKIRDKATALAAAEKAYTFAMRLGAQQGNILMWSYITAIDAPVERTVAYKEYCTICHEIEITPYPKGQFYQALTASGLLLRKVNGVNYIAPRGRYRGVAALAANRQPLGLLDLNQEVGDD